MENFWLPKFALLGIEDSRHRVIFFVRELTPLLGKFPCTSLIFFYGVGPEWYLKVPNRNSSHFFMFAELHCVWNYFGLFYVLQRTTCYVEDRDRFCYGSSGVAFTLA